MDTLTIVEIAGFDQLQRERPETLDADWTDFFARMERPFRMLSLPAPYDLGPALRQLAAQLGPLEARERALRPLAETMHAWETGATPSRLQELLAGLPEALGEELRALLGDGDRQARTTWARALDALARPLWRIGPLRSYRQELEGHQRRGTLRGLRHFLLAWLPPGSRPQQLIQSIEETFDTAAWEASLPSLLPGAYTHEYRHLAPADPRHPFITFLAAYDRQGRWDSTVLHRVLHLPTEAALCVDVGMVDPRVASALVDHTEVSTAGALAERHGPRDVRAERKHQSAHRLQELLTTQKLHELRFVLAVSAPTPEALDDGVRQVRDALGSRMRLMRPGGGQRRLELFFRPVPSAQIVAPARGRREPSRGVAVSVPFGVRKPTEAQGMELVRDGTTPITLDLFRPGQAAHGLVVGATGIGKTFALFCWLRRLAVQQGVQVILYEPQGHGRYIAAACGNGARHLVLNAHQRANVLDVVISRSHTGERPALIRQVEHVVTQIGVLLASSGADSDMVEPRVWSSLERGTLALALQDLYAPWADDLGQLAPADTPALADLCDVLRCLAETEEGATVATAQALADEIDLRLVRGPHGHMFNGTTTIDWQLGEHDVLAYDFSELDAPYLQTFYYAAAFGALYRHIHNPERPRQRPVLAAIDEFRIMAQIPGLRAFVASYMKHARTFGGHLWVVDQDFHILDAPDEASQSIITNTPLRVLFHQERKNAERIAATLDGIRPHHVKAIQKAVRGQCVVMWKAAGVESRAQEVVVGRVVPTPEEFAHFRRT